MQTPNCVKMNNYQINKSLLYVLKLKLLRFVSVFSVSVQNMAAYVMLVTVIFVLVYSLTLSEVTVTFPNTSWFYPCWSALCSTNCVITPILNYPKNAFCIRVCKWEVFISVNNEQYICQYHYICGKIGLLINHNVHCVSLKEFRW